MRGVAVDAGWESSTALSTTRLLSWPTSCTISTTNKVCDRRNTDTAVTQAQHSSSTSDMGGSGGRTMSKTALAVPCLKHAFLPLLLGAAAATSILGRRGGLVGAEALPTDGGGQRRPTLVTQKTHDHSSSAPPVRVYVYEDAALDHTDLIQCYRDRHNGASPWQDERADMAQDMGEIWLHRALLAHPWRVLDPELADVFFIPLYPVLSLKLLGVNDKKCGGRTHTERISASVRHLQRESTYFNRFGGADHVVVCAWWNCKKALGRSHRMVLRRAVVGINEPLAGWANWGCGGRMVTVPYTASSVMTASGMLGGRAAAERDISFFFVGTGRNRPERQNLEVVRELFPDSVIELGDNMNKWDMNATVYAEHMSRSRFCFCPRGDSMSSRRIFDAISAGCIPVLTEAEERALPFRRTGLNYTEFAVVAARDGFKSHAKVKAVVQSIRLRSEEQLAILRGAMGKGVNSIIYGTTTGPELSDMHPFLGTASRFLQEVKAVGGGEKLWSCPPVHLDYDSLAPRTWEDFPPSESKRTEWLSESETIVNEEHSLLFCAPPNTGSMQFRMLAKRMQGVGHWAVSDDRALLFDPIASELPLLDVTNGPLMKEIYKNNDGGWIKIGVVRDPVTRLLSAYLDLVHAWKSASLAANHNGRRRRELLGDGDYDWLELNPCRGQRRQTEEMWHRGNDRHKEEEEEEEGGEGGKSAGINKHGRRIKDEDGENEEERAHESEDALDEATTLIFSNGNIARGGKGKGGDVAIPTFAELVEVLEDSTSSVPPAFRPMANLCGARYSPFESIIPFETLQQTSTEVLKSLPGGIWDAYGASGWGPEGQHAFMEFDYGEGVWRDDKNREHAPDDSGGEREGGDATALARELFDGTSCAWTEYYADTDILDTVERIYAADYALYGWYDIDAWRGRLKACLKERG